MNQNWMRLAVLAGVSAALSASAAAKEPESLVIESVVLSPMQVAEVPAQQTGVLQQIVAAEGATIGAGDVVAQLDARQATLDVAKAELERQQAAARAGNQTKLLFAEKSLQVAQAELRRSEESVAQFAKSISQSQLDVEQLTVEKLLLEKEQAEHELQLERYTHQLKQQELAAAQLRLELHEVRAPFAGTVALIRGRAGEWVEVGQSVARIVAVTTLRAEGFLDADLASDNLVGIAVRFRPLADLPSADGVLKFVSPEMDPVTRQVRVWAEIHNPEGRLRSGQQGTLELIRPTR